jgi:hypothetical protein
MKKQKKSRTLKDRLLGLEKEINLFTAWAQLCEQD